jgi:alginate O-acetyltransferase complex protein AlgI
MMKRYEGVKTERKIWLAIALSYNIGMLVFFKYINFILENINVLRGTFFDGGAFPLPELGLPLGISFYTFQAVSYVVDAYKSQGKNNSSLLQFAAYLTMFPKLVSGPIVSYGDMEEQLTDRKFSFFKFEKGLKLFTVGLGMKVLLANRLGILWNDIQTIGFESISTPLAWLGSVGYSLQLYFDFQGYSLMAIGVGRMLGFHLPDNFNHPYMAKSMTEFWRRWHITLGMWFRQYVYIPLGGNRKGKGRLVLNLLVVWLLTGLWHGAGWNFILWGLVLFLLILMEKLYFKPVLERSKLLARIYMLLAIPLTWTLFATGSLSAAGSYFGRLFGVVPGINVNTSDFIKYFGQFKWLILVGCFFCFPYGRKLYLKYQNHILMTVILFVIFWYSVYQMAIGNNNPFLYFQF